MSESLKKQAKTREEIRIETRELKRTEETNGCYNPFNIVHQEVQRRLKEKWIPDPVVLPLIVDLQEKLQSKREAVESLADKFNKTNEAKAELEGRLKETEKEFARQLERLSDLKVEKRLSAIQKHWLELPTIEISYKEGKRLKKWGDKMYKLLGLVGEEQ